MSCIICYCPIEHEHHCSDKRCKEVYCRECVESLIDFCVGEQILPKCLARDCPSYLTLTDFEGIDKSIIQKYHQLCLTYFLKDQGDMIEKQLQEKVLLKKYSEDRQKFIQDEFPAGISLMASIAFKSKLKRIEKQKAAVLKVEVKHRRCMNSTCSGFLLDMVCTVCQTEFCKKCEKVNDNHVCKQEDMDSVNFVNGLCHCPQCKLPVFKNQGCDNISCSVCGTRFLYSTGEKGGSGSHNIKIAVDVEQRYKLSVLYKDKIPSSCLKSLLHLESLEPKAISKNTLLDPIKKYITTKDEKYAKILANKIDAYYQNRFLMRDYQASLVKLEQRLKKDKEIDTKVNRYIKQFS